MNGIDNCCENCLVESAVPFLAIADCFDKKQLNFCSVDCSEEFILTKRLQIDFYNTKRKLTQNEREDMQKKKKSQQNDDDEDEDEDDDVDDIIDTSPEKIIVSDKVDKIVLTDLLGKGSYGRAYAGYYEKEKEYHTFEKNDFYIHGGKKYRIKCVEINSSNVPYFQIKVANIKWILDKLPPGFFLKKRNSKLLQNASTNDAVIVVAKKNLLVDGIFTLKKAVDENKVNLNGKYIDEQKFNECLIDSNFVPNTLVIKLFDVSRPQIQDSLREEFVLTQLINQRDTEQELCGKGVICALEAFICTPSRNSLKIVINPGIFTFKPYVPPFIPKPPQNMPILEKESPKQTQSPPTEEKENAGGSKKGEPTSESKKGQQKENIAEPPTAKISDELKIFDFDSCPIKGDVKLTKSVGYITFPFKIGDNLNLFVAKMKIVLMQNPRLWLKTCLIISKNLHTYLQKLHAIMIFNHDIKPSNTYVENDFDDFLNAVGILPDFAVYFIDFGVGCSGRFKYKNDPVSACSTSSISEIGTSGFIDYQMLKDIGKYIEPRLVERMANGSLTMEEQIEFHDMILHSKEELKSQKIYKYLKLMDLFALGVSINLLFRSEDEEKVPRDPSDFFTDMPEFFLNEKQLKAIGLKITKPFMRKIEQFLNNSIGTWKKRKTSQW